MGQISDIGDQLAAREQVGLLRAGGFGDLLEAIEAGDAFTAAGRFSAEKLAHALGMSKPAAAELLEQARQSLDPWVD